MVFSQPSRFLITTKDSNTITNMTNNNMTKPTRRKKKRRAADEGVKKFEGMFLKILYLIVNYSVVEIEYFREVFSVKLDKLPCPTFQHGLRSHLIHLLNIFI